MLPRINAIAAEIHMAFFDLRSKRTGEQPKWVKAAQPLVDAMLEIRSVNDFYGVDHGEKIILDFLHIVGDRWHGPDSDRLRGLLRQHLYIAKEKNASH